LFLTANSLVPFLFGDQWLDSIHYLEILAFAGIFYPMNVLLITLIKSTGRSDLFLRVEIIKKIIIMIALLIASRFSVETMAWSLVLTGFIAYLFNSSFAIPLVNYSWKLQFFDILPSIVLFMIATLMTFFISRLYTEVSHVYHILFTSIIFTIIILPFFYLFRKNYFNDIWELLVGVTNKIKNK
jgi:O-antigen/teichoic acid export membrane protein